MKPIFGGSSPQKPDPDSLDPLDQIYEEDDTLLHAVRSILLGQDRERLEELDRKLETWQNQSQESDELLEKQADEIFAEIKSLWDSASKIRTHTSTLQESVDVLERKAQISAEGEVERLTPVLTNLIRRTIYDSPDDMAEAIGPVMGEAIRVQIRDSRKDMVEALYPVIGETVQKAVAEFAREFQRNIDSRIKATFGPQGTMRRVTARLRGVSDAELALRDALPFRIEEIFLIQHGSGLLISHTHPGTAEVTDSDLISAMLTAIRDFVQDAFAQGDVENKELDEIQYGNLRISIQSGKHAYLAIVYVGVEPEGFRAASHKFISELHVKYSNAFRDFTGDPVILPNLQPMLAQLVEQLTSEEGSGKISRAQLWVFIGGIFGLIATVALACFYLQFTIALYPIAFPSITPSITITPSPTVTNTSTHTPTFTPSPTNTITPTFTLTPSLTPTPVQAYMGGNAWVRAIPASEAPRLEVIYENTPVLVKAIYGPWAKITWFASDGLQEGWVPLWSVTVAEAMPIYLEPPSATPEP